MSLIVERGAVLTTYADAARRGWVVPCFGSENLTTTEAVLEAALNHANLYGIPDLPVTIAITGAYAHRSQASFYTHTRDVGLGLRLFLADLRELTASGSPYARLRVLAHFDHAQHDLDAAALTSGEPGPWSSIMYDAANLPFADNIERTRAFVRQRGGSVVIEGACDEIVDAGGGGGDLTSPARAVEFLKQTGVDLMVANLGTEHRASGADLRYRGDLARACSAQVGGILVLHGCSSVPASELGNLFADGVRKVNIWTMLERDASPVLLADLVANADKVAGGKAKELFTRGLLGPSAPISGRAQLSHFTTVHRQDLIHRAMVGIAASFFALWYR